MEVPEGFEEFYGAYVLLLLLQTIYGLKQAAMAFWRELVKALPDMNFKISAADPCLYHCWTMYGLVVWLSWIDDCLVAGDKRAVEAAKEQMKSRFECDDLGELNEYVGCKIDRDEDSVKFTQPVLIQSYEDEFELNKTRQVFTPEEQGKVLMKCDQGTKLGGKEQKKYRSGVGKLLHMMQWSRPEIYNAVRELLRFMTVGASDAHIKAMTLVMEYCVETKDLGLVLNPNVKWNGDP
jgi:hypothetical protein